MGLRDWWCRVMHMAVGEFVYTQHGEYAGTLWHCRDCDRSYVSVTWRRDSDEYAPLKGFE